MVTALIERCRSRHRSHDGRLQRCRQAPMLVLCAAIVSVVLFTSIIWRRDKVSAPYRAWSQDLTQIAETPTVTRRGTSPACRAFRWESGRADFLRTTGVDHEPELIS